MTSHTFVLPVRNVNEALWQLVQHASLAHTEEMWRGIAPRGMPTKEFRGLWITEYLKPTERVLFYKERDAHPFFHFMESLWILAGRRDVAWIARYLPRIATYSDDGEVFHAAYGHRMRHHFQKFDRLVSHTNHEPVRTYHDLDQLVTLIDHLTEDPDSRRAVMSFWDPANDLNVQSKDLPCNDTLMFKVRDGVLDLTVCCRSNDAVWGAYGTNAVQFSVIQEFVAGALGIPVGVYRQISDSFHIYDDNEAWARLGNLSLRDPYSEKKVQPYPLIKSGSDYMSWLSHLQHFMEGRWHADTCSFFKEVAFPIKEAWDLYMGDTPNKIMNAAQLLQQDCAASDWRLACIEWLLRREGK